jgi:hypothetical protein
MSCSSTDAQWTHSVRRARAPRSCCCPPLTRRTCAAARAAIEGEQQPQRRQAVCRHCLAKMANVERAHIPHCCRFDRAVLVKASHTQTPKPQLRHHDAGAHTAMQDRRSQKGDTDANKDSRRRSMNASLLHCPQPSLPSQGSHPPPRRRARSPTPT